MDVVGREGLQIDLEPFAALCRRRKRTYARVVKVKMPNFLKRPEHGETQRDFDAETQIVGELGRTA